MHAPSVYRSARAQVGEIRMETVLEIAPSFDDTENQKRHIESLRMTITNRERELKNSFRGSALDMGEVQALTAKWKDGVMELESRVGNEDFWNATQDFYYEYQQPVDDAFRALYAKLIFDTLKFQMAP